MAHASLKKCFHYSLVPRFLGKLKFPRTKAGVDLKMSHLIASSDFPRVVPNQMPPIPIPRLGIRLQTGLGQLESWHHKVNI